MTKFKYDPDFGNPYTDPFYQETYTKDNSNSEPIPGIKHNILLKGYKYKVGGVSHYVFAETKNEALEQIQGKAHSYPIDNGKAIEIPFYCRDIDLIEEPTTYLFKEKESRDGD